MGVFRCIRRIACYWKVDKHPRRRFPTGDDIGGFTSPMVFPFMWVITVILLLHSGLLQLLHASGIAAKRAIKVGVLIIGAGYLAVQALSYYGYLSVSFPHPEEALRAPLDFIGNTRLSPEQTDALRSRVKWIFSRSLPSTAGFGAGLGWGILYG
ncbi:fun14 family protein [Cyclospora cayetanensis]|uniref:Fun14 family protein n=1 Tax=Cyclospora cayetanensis TaxID=88456 RepID=A0A1D3D4F1_9EIME|nr:fun14 family protein [Cyclospora cayetanensis]